VPPGHEAVGDGQGVDEAGTDRLHVERDAHRTTQLALDDSGRGGEGHVGGGRGDDDQVDVGGRPAGGGQGLLGGLDGQIRHGLVVRRPVSATNAGALPDPVVGGVDDARQVLIGDDVLG